MTEISDAIKRHEGCNLAGWLELERVAGNIHFSVRPEALFMSMKVRRYRWYRDRVGCGGVGGVL